jgi:hypothetical protein
MNYNTNMDGISSTVESLDQSPVASSRTTVLVPTSQQNTGAQPLTPQNVVVGPVRDPDLSVPRLPGSARGFALDRLLDG